MPNIPGFTNYPLRDRMEGLTQLPATLENDANAAALGEFLAGGGRDIENMVLLTLGTGKGEGDLSRAGRPPRVERSGHDVLPQ